MRIETHLGGEGAANLRLSDAILIYQNGEQAAATLHQVQEDPRRRAPVILPGTPIERKNFIEIAQRLSGTQMTNRRQLLDASLLIADADLLCWYRPSHRRTIFFKTKSAELDALNGAEALHPALLFVARLPSDLYVYALGADHRPTLDTVLFRAPYFNIYAGAHLCEGNFKLPDHFRPDGIPHWEKAFFDTSFSHTNLLVRELTTFAGGHTALWKAMCKTGRGAAKEFPAESLVPMTFVVTRVGDGGVPVGQKTKGPSPKTKPLTLRKVVE